MSDSNRKTRTVPAPPPQDPRPDVLAFIETLPLPVVVVSDSGAIVSVNPAAHRILGPLPTRASADAWTHILESPEAGTRTAEHASPLLAALAAHPSEETLVRFRDAQTGAIHAAAILNLPLRHRPKVCALIFCDRGSAESTRATIESSLQLPRPFLDFLDEAVVVVDRSWTITHYNTAASGISGRSAKEAVGTSLWAFCADLAGTEVEAVLRRAMDGAAPIACEHHFPTHEKWLDVRALPVGDSIAIVTRDVTASQTRAAAVHALTTELAAIAGTPFFRALVARLGTILAARCVFIAEIGAGPRMEASTLALWNDGELQTNASIPVDDLSWREQSGGDDSIEWEISPEGMQALGKALNVSGDFCHAVALRSPGGNARGLIGCIDPHTPVPTQAIIEIMSLFALRAATELERQRDMLRIEANENRLHILSRVTNDAIWDWNIETDHVWRNDAFDRLFGRTDDFTGFLTSNIQRIHPEDAGRVRDGVRALLLGGATIWQDDYRYKRTDGTYAYVFDRAYVVRVPSGKAVRMVGCMSDITERLDAAQRLREQADILNRASDAIIVRALDDRITYWNQGAEHLYGLPSSDAIRREARVILGGEAEDYDRATARVMERGEWSGELRGAHTSGQSLIVSARWTLVRSPGGEPEAILAIHTDMTERKRLESQYLRAQRLESIGVLAGGIAHDLNNMLTPITIAVDMLKRMHVDDDTCSLVESIESSARRGADLVRQVLGFARGVEGKRIAINPGFIVRDIVKIARETFPKSIRVRSEAPRDPWLVVGDPTQLHQVLLNLCVNARDAMPDGGEILLAVSAESVRAPRAELSGTVMPGEYVAISVRDSGTGIPSAIADRIFDPFFTTKDPEKGTGLGLATVLAIVKSHGGHVSYTTAEERGTTFRILLPADKRSSPPSAVEVLAELPRGRGELLLVVDDEAYIRALVKQTLESFGYRVLVASDGATALASYADRAGEVDLVLTDMMMPGMDGPAFIRALQKLDPRARILAASGMNADTMVEQAKAAGVDEFLPKPYTVEALLTRVADILRRHPAA